MQSAPDAGLPERQRRRAIATYFVTVALTSVAYIASFTVAALIAPELTGWAGSSGLPSTFAVAGTAAGAGLLGGVNARRGRRFGIRLGLAGGILGAGLSMLATIIGSFPVLLFGSLTIGFANAGIQATRYAAADLYPVARRAGALSLIVWASTFGAVIGPNLIGPAGSLAPAIGLSTLASALLPTLVFLVLALAVIQFGPHVTEARAPADEMPEVGDPITGAVASPARRSGWRLAGDLLASPVGRAALLTLVAGQLVMTLIMTMTPYHLHDHGHGLETVGFVISAHTLGMFALSPISGRLTDRFGPLTMIAASFGTLAGAGLLAAVAPPEGGITLALPLFLLGVGWNMGFVAGSALLAGATEGGHRVRRQGVADALVWTAGGLASTSSGLVVAWFGYVALAIVGAAIAVALAVAVTLTLRGTRLATA